MFVRHDLARDPPFSKLDLVSCRNVLIYFDQALQKRILPTLHYALNQPGFLLLGRTESISGFSQLFSADRQGQQDLRADGGGEHAPLRSPRRDASGHLAAERLEPGRRPAPAYRSICAGTSIGCCLARYAPPGVLINERMEVLQFRGETGAYLSPRPESRRTTSSRWRGRGCSRALRATIAQGEEGAGAGPRAREWRSSRTASTDAPATSWSCPSRACPTRKEPLFVVLFEEARRTESRAEAAEAPSGRSTGAARRRGSPRLEHELAATKEYLQSLIEEHGRTNDELGAANEELVSGNEELQSMNEELETAKEELQSTNEELTTVNDELHSRNQEVNASQQRPDEPARPPSTSRSSSSTWSGGSAASRRRRAAS